MKPNKPRITLVDPQDFTDEQAALAGGRDSLLSGLNITRAIVQHPRLFESWKPFAEHIGLRSELPDRDREVFLLRILALCGETYETSHHQFIARKIGLSEADIASAQRGSGSLLTFEKTLVQAALELVRDHCISDETWTFLGERYKPNQLMELIFTGGMYIVLSLFTNSIGIEPESDVEHAWKPV